MSGETGSLKGIPVRVEQVARQADAVISSARQGAARGADDEGSPLFEAHRKIYPRAVTGLFARWRWGMVILTQLVFYGLPWLQWNDRQAVLFDLGARKFYIFGLVLWPQDFFFLTALLVMSALVLFLFTAVAGRLWCGYACPQTVYTELFMWIERKIEGDRNARMKLDAAPWSARKLARKGGKHAAWILLALWTGFTFVAYFTPARTLGHEVITLGLGPWQTFWILFYSFATWGNAGFMREQVCKYMCPYARFQGAMFDKDTLVITYDAKRGEPRGARGRKADPAKLGLGSCIDCNLCVQVCPTGIDIRNGQQYECIGCAACIDVCDEVMKKMGYAPGLVRYATQRSMTAPDAAFRLLRHVLRPRTLVYGTILGLIGISFLWGLATRDPVRVDVIRDRNTLSRLVEDRVENVYRLQLMNATEREATYAISVSGLPDIAIASEREVKVKPADSRMLPVRVQVPQGVAEAGSRPIRFVVTETGSGARVEEESVFMVPR